MNRNIFLLFIFIGCACLNAAAQNDSINWLDEVRLSDVKLKTNSEGQLVKVLNDSLIQQSEPLLTSILKFNSPFFFRENGYGMVSSASVRGTGASQTAVIWNGININSQFTGQTDFNTINTKVFDNISLRPGGGSVVYGSGAIGGTIHLNNEFTFSGDSANQINLGYGSFDTSQASYKGEFSNLTTSLRIGLAGIISENDYEYLGTDAYNENGDFYNASFSTSLAQWLGDSNIIKLYSNYYQGDRGFSGTITQPSNSKYEDRNSRNLLEWKAFAGDFTSSLKFAWLRESFKYFENRDTDNYSFGEADTGIIKYDLGYDFSSDKKLNFIADYTGINGEGTGILNTGRKIGGVSILWNHQIENLKYQLSIRQEFTEDFNSPLLFSAGASYQLSRNYLLRINSSRNFRIPTFNDLYWLDGGNPDLGPETSLQAEIGNEFSFNDLNLNLTAYFIDIDNLIRWVPDGSGLWRPLNTAEAKNYGIEVFGEWTSQFLGNRLNLNGTYAFTRSIDKETVKQLIYTPKHKATISAGYEIKGFSLLWQSLYNGSIYTSSDNAYELDSYLLSNFTVGYSITRKPEIGISVQVNNLFNEKYQSLPSRIMPGRSLQSTLTFKF